MSGVARHLLARNCGHVVTSFGENTNATLAEIFVKLELHEKQTFGLIDMRLSRSSDVVDFSSIMVRILPELVSGRNA
ncbi:MAG: hypothetical protein ACREBC_37585 [Pyrinomonadaceae bacterium]